MLYKEGTNEMVINHDITEDQLKDVYQAAIAIQLKKGHTEKEATETARLLSYGVFRNLFTYESIVNSVVDNARRVFTK